jgi:hypothetical protein
MAVYTTWPAKAKNIRVTKAYVRKMYKPSKFHHPRLMRSYYICTLYKIYIAIL